MALSKEFREKQVRDSYAVAAEPSLRVAFYKAVTLKYPTIRLRDISTQSRTRDEDVNGFASLSDDLPPASWYVADLDLSIKLPNGELFLQRATLKMRGGPSCLIDDARSSGRQMAELYFEARQRVTFG